MAGNDQNNASPAGVLDKPFRAELQAQANLDRRMGAEHSAGMDTTTMNAMGHSGSMGNAAPKLSADYYQQWRADTQAKLDRGEDPYADFARRAKEQHNNTLLGRIFGKGKRDKVKEAKAKLADDGVVR